jgi:hypothetical protein
MMSPMTWSAQDSAPGVLSIKKVRRLSQNRKEISAMIGLLLACLVLFFLFAVLGFAVSPLFFFLVVVVLILSMGWGGYSYRGQRR